MIHVHLHLGCDFTNEEPKSTDLLPTAFLQPVDHLLKLQLAELHFLFQLIHKHVIV